MVHLVVASTQEARPLIDRYRLAKRNGTHPYPIYAKDEMTLIVSGIGKIFAASAVAYLQALSARGKTTAWLNLGIAGHGKLDIGLGFLAHRVEDQATGRCYYPPRVFPFSASTSNLLTVDRPAAVYAVDRGYDMEASGFYQSAVRCATAEWVHCYKVVSDNPMHPLEKVKKARVAALIEDRLEEIDAIIETLGSQAFHWQRFDDSGGELDAMTSRLHFTETRKAQLRRLVQRWKAMENAPILSCIDPGAYASAEALLDDVRRRLTAHHRVY